MKQYDTVITDKKYRRHEVCACVCTSRCALTETCARLCWRCGNVISGRECYLQHCALNSSYDGLAWISNLNVPHFMRDEVVEIDGIPQSTTLPVYCTRMIRRWRCWPTLIKWMSLLQRTVCDKAWPSGQSGFKGFTKDKPWTWLQVFFIQYWEKKPDIVIVNESVNSVLVIDVGCCLICTWTRNIIPSNLNTSH